MHRLLRPQAASPCHQLRHSTRSRERRPWLPECRTCHSNHAQQTWDLFESSAGISLCTGLLLAPCKKARFTSNTITFLAILRPADGQSDANNVAASKRRRLRGPLALCEFLTAQAPIPTSAFACAVLRADPCTRALNIAFAQHLAAVGSPLQSGASVRRHAVRSTGTVVKKSLLGASKRPKLCRSTCCPALELVQTRAHQPLQRSSNVQPWPAAPSVQEAVDVFHWRRTCRVGPAAPSPGAGASPDPSHLRPTCGHTSPQGTLPRSAYFQPPDVHTGVHLHRASPTAM